MKSTNLEDFCESEFVGDNRVGLLVQNGYTDQKVEIGTGLIRPDDLPQLAGVEEAELALEPDQNPSETEVHVV